VNIVNCSSKGVLFYQVTQPDISNAVTSEDIQAFNTWNDKEVSLNNAFITLQFTNNIVITRTVVYYLVPRDLKVREPKGIELFSSTTESIYPITEIKGVQDSVFTMLSTGMTNIQRNSDDDDDVISSNYEYRKYNLTIPPAFVH